MDENIHKGHRKRLRQRFEEDRFSGCAPHQVMEFLLSYAHTRGDVNPIAHNLINRFGSVDKVLDAPAEELMKIKGVGEKTASFLRMIPAISAYYIDSKQSKKETLTTTEELGEYFIPKFLDKTDECSYLLSMNNRRQVLNCSLISEGTATRTPFPIRTVTDILLRYRATAAVVAHNHPNGFAIPSKADCLVTSDLNLHLQKIEVKLLDHIIVSGMEYVSMKDSGAFRDF